MAIKTPEEKKEEVKQTPVKTKSESIAIDSIEEKEENIEVDFQDEDLANSFAAKGTKPNKDKVKIDDSTSADDVLKGVHEYEASKSTTLNYGQLKKQSEFLINLVDTALSTAFNFFAKGEHNSDYRMEKGSKDLLIEQLAQILSKYQDKFKVEYMFFIGLFIMYAPMAVAANKNRKAKGKKVKEEKVETKVEQKVEEKVVEKKVEEKIVEQTELPLKPLKKKPGPRAKAY